MARLNIEEIFFVEIMDVAVKMGGSDLAIGNAIRWFRFSQEKHKKGKLVSEKEFKDNNFSEALFPLFAERVDGGIACAGAGKHFSWLLSKSEAGSAGGKASVESRKNSTGSAIPKGATNSPPPKQTEAEPKQPEEGQSNAKQTEAAEPSPSSSFFPSDFNSVVGAPTASVFGNSHLDFVFNFVPRETQNRWVETYEKNSVKETLLNGVDYYLTKNKPKKINEISDWGEKLVTWMIRENKTLKRKATPHYANTLPPTSLIDTGPEVSPSEALKTAKAKNFGSTIINLLQKKAGGE
jgi:hypothetical protein